MLRVALTGGLSSGKSTVAAMFAQLGCPAINADETGHRLLERGAPGYESVVAAFGRAILNDLGEIDRARLGSIVFANEDARRRLNDILHPLIMREIYRELADLERAGTRIAIIEAALFVEEGLHNRFDRLIAVTSHREQKLQRFQQRTGATREQAEARVTTQLSDEAKAQVADYVIDNSKDLENTRRQVAQVWAKLKDEIRD